MSSQDDIHDAFLWVRQVYDEASVFLDDTQKIAAELGYRAWDGGIKLTSSNVLRVGEFPFVYLAAVFFSPEATWDDEAGSAIFLAIDFHSDNRKGPYVLVGTVRYTSSDKVNAVLLNETARRWGGRGYFQTKKPTSPSLTYVHVPAGDYKGFAGVEEVRHVELPLTVIDTPEKLRALVVGAVAFFDGDEAGLRPFVAPVQPPQNEAVADSRAQPPPKP